MINYKGTPLFGPDSSAQHTSEFFAIAGTILFWILFLIFSFVIKPQPKKPEYKEVQIVLSSTPVVQKTEESPAPAEQAAAPSAASEPQIVETPVVEPPSSSSASVKETKTTKKPAEKKTETSKPQQTENKSKTIYMTDEERYQLQLAQKKTKTTHFDDSLFDDDDSNEDTESKTVKVPDLEYKFSGEEGKSIDKNNEPLVSQSNNNQKQEKASNELKEQLEGIKKVPFMGKAENGIQSKTEVQTVNSGSGKVTVPMSNGRSRALIDPEEPIINIPPELYYLIDSTRTVNISFKVINSGNVTDVRISPESSLHSSIRQEIIGQLLFWRFEAADYTATANFEYTIIKQ